jgi:L-iditol 2-dehydrogenase
VPRQHRAALDLLASGRVKAKPLISHRLPLERIEEGFEVAESRAGMKVIVEP